MTAELPTDTPAASSGTWGTAHLAWAALLCSGGIYGLATSQAANQELRNSLGGWTQAFAAAGVLSIVGLAILHAWGGQSLRRGAIWPAAGTWSLLTSGSILALVAATVLSLGMHSRLLLGGGAAMIAALLSGGIGTVALTSATICLASRPPSDEEAEIGPQTTEEQAERLRLEVFFGIGPLLAALATAAIALFAEW